MAPPPAAEAPAAPHTLDIDLSALLGPLTACAELREVLAGAQPRRRLSVADAAKGYVLAGLQRSLGRTVALVTARPGTARQLWEELVAWTGGYEGAVLFPTPDSIPYESLAPDATATAERIKVLSRLAEAGDPCLVILSARAAMDPFDPPERFRASLRRLSVGEKIGPAALANWLVTAGYEVGALVDEPGQFSRRGGIVDVYPPGERPYRIEFFGDEIESLRDFDPETQRSGQRVSSIDLAPARERAELPEGAEAAGGAAAAHATFFEHLPDDAIVVLDEPSQIDVTTREIERQAEELRLQLTEKGELEQGASRPYLPWQNVLSSVRAGSRPVIDLAHDPGHETLAFSHAPTFAGRLRSLIGRFAEGTRPAEITAIVSLQTARLQELFGERGVDAAPLAAIPTDALVPGGLVLVHGSLPAGWTCERLGLTVLTDAELFGWRKVRRPARRSRGAARDAFLSDLEPGELVVHVDHGIARYRGLIRPSARDQEAGTARREFLLLEYENGDHLYVPIEQSDRVTRYVGGGEERPSLTRLGTSEWSRAKARVRRAVRDIARDLIDLYAARKTVQGHAFPVDTTWQAELEDSFPFEETPDQLEAIQEVKRDMQRQEPMDRLLVGDVGYGKTEVALRAAFKAVMDGRQVAVLVPTTVLAQQHATTFTERFGAFPVRVEMLSRFRTPPEQRVVIKNINEGSVDVCIGTHRMLSTDVKFKNLGLVIIDEEQRFGVAHKERLKQLRTEVDVLTLTATPIPRTLHMSLAGVRDMSVIQTPPEERLPIRSYVLEYDEGIVREAILRELDRGGQVYFVHNRVRSIEVLAAQLRRLVPEARFSIGHGQMDEEQLEQVMVDFANGLADVLICTTIIESGLDISNVNTIIVNNAHRFGLAQLYQLRGRVGRSAARAYAYFMYARDTQLTEHAEQRLRTIFEATELGAGFRIAMKDLEIRGAGNLLGAEQSGQIAAVGFDLYTRLLGEAIELLKAAESGLPIPVQDATAPESRPSFDLPLEAMIPATYVADEATRLNLYQRLAGVTTGEALGAIIGELEDRFGGMPPETQNLMFLISLRLQAQALGISHVSSAESELVVRFHGSPPPRAGTLSSEVGVLLKLGSNQIRMPRGRGQDWMPRLQRLFDALASA
ncbi:MAG: transcription-repair coupling factor [Chloroflexota bacterium]